MTSPPKTSTSIGSATLPQAIADPQTRHHGAWQYGDSLGCVPCGRVKEYVINMRYIQKSSVLFVLVVTSLAFAFLGVAGYASPVAAHNLPIPAAFTPTVVLYDPALGGTPQTQGALLYAAISFPPAPIDAAATFSAGATVLTTTVDLSESAGWSLNPASAPELDRAPGYTLHFMLQLLEEQHLASDDNGDSLDDRAGFSIIALSADKLGIELGFWEDRVWAQEGGSEPALFTQAESAALDPTTGFEAYALTIRGDRYTLTRGGATILSGMVRDYTAFEPTLGQLDPYETANFVFLGDNTSRAGSRARIGLVALEIGARVMLPLIIAPE